MQTKCPENKILDLRKFSRAEGEFRVMAAFEAIGPHCSFLVVTDHEPVTLRQEFEGELRDRYLWQTIEDGPQQWQFLITKLQG